MDEFNENVIIQLYGYKTNAEYYQDISSCNRIGNVTVPLLGILSIIYIKINIILKYI